LKKAVSLKIQSPHIVLCNKDKKSATYSKGHVICFDEKYFSQLRKKFTSIKKTKITKKKFEITKEKI